MSSPDSQRSSAIRATLEGHVKRRLNEALSKITGADAASEKERKKQREFFRLASLLSSGADCANQIQLATHIVKGVHPDPKVKMASNLNVDIRKMPSLSLVGSHVLAGRFEVDATGNGAFNKKIFEVFLLLKTPFDGVTVLDLLKCEDPAAIAALSDTPDQAKRWGNILAEIDAPRCARVASHTLAKQIYWPVGDDRHDDATYHLLAPLYPTSLVHRVYQALQEDRFSDAAKAAREARKAGEPHERPVREYPNLAIQQLGGTKPQNISQLNSERRGDNCLLASLPPVWKSAEVKPLYGVDSLFKRFGWRKEVRTLAGHLRRFLESDPTSNAKTRQRRDELVDALIEELMQFAAELGTLDPGWSADPQCDLSPTHRVWLDPEGSGAGFEDAADRVASDFANWLNAQLRDPLPVGDSEFLYWRRLAREQFKLEEREAAHEQ